MTYREPERLHELRRQFAAHMRARRTADRVAEISRQIKAQQRALFLLGAKQKGISHD
jgi:hypothetical protein